MKASRTSSKRIVEQEGFVNALVELGWEKGHIAIVLRRVLSLAEEGEDFVEIAKRLNPPRKGFKRPLTDIRVPVDRVFLGSSRL